MKVKVKGVKVPKVKTGKTGKTKTGKGREPCNTCEYLERSRQIQRGEITSPYISEESPMTSRINNDRNEKGKEERGAWGYQCRSRSRRRRYAGWNHGCSLFVVR